MQAELLNPGSRHFHNILEVIAAQGPYPTGAFHSFIVSNKLALEAQNYRFSWGFFRKNLPLQDFHSTTSLDTGKFETAII